MTEGFITRSKPESVAAAEAVRDSLAVAFVDGTFSPWLKSAELQSLAERIKKEDHPAWNGRPTVVFYTCEGATMTQVSNTKQKTESVFELQSSVMSAKVRDDIFDVMKSRQPCIYTMFVNLVKVDISQITPEHDSFINNETGPFIGFFNIHGECVSMLSGSQIGSASYTRAISQLIGNPSASMRRFAEVKSGLDKLEEMTRQAYVTDQQLEEALAKAKKTESNKTRLIGSVQMNSLSSKTSVDAVRAEKLQSDKAALTARISTVKTSIDQLTSTAVGCEGCPVCLEKAAAAAAATTQQSESY